MLTKIGHDSVSDSESFKHRSFATKSCEHQALPLVDELGSDGTRCLTMVSSWASADD